MSDVEKILGVSLPFPINGKVVEIHPVRLKHWNEFSKNLYPLIADHLYESYKFDDGPGMMETILRIVTREKDVPEELFEMNQADFLRLREMVRGQNELDFDGILERQRTIEEKGKLDLLSL